MLVEFVKVLLFVFSVFRERIARVIDHTYFFWSLGQTEDGIISRQLRGLFVLKEPIKPVRISMLFLLRVVVVGRHGKDLCNESKASCPLFNVKVHRREVAGKP